MYSDGGIKAIQLPFIESLGRFEKDLLRKAAERKKNDQQLACN